MTSAFARSFSDHIGVDSAGRLRVEDVDAGELAREFGTPLYVISEHQIYANVSDYTQAFTSRYPRSRVLFATKANNNLTVRRLFTLAGAGGDAFGAGELYLTLLAGTDPDLVVLNGFNKCDDEIRMAVETGVAIHLDAPDELDDVIRIAREAAKTARVGMRSRLLLHELDSLESDWPPGIAIGPGAREINKFGMGIEDLEATCRRALAAPEVDLVGLHHHVGRWRADVGLYKAVVREQVEAAARLRDVTEWVPEYLDFGGGMAWGRSEGHGPLGNDQGSPNADDYAEAITGVLRAELERHALGDPLLLIEPGRAIASNIGVLLTRVGIRKTFPDVGHTWIGVDASQNLMLNILSGGFYYHPVAAERMDDEPLETVNVADPLCWFGNLALSCRLPHLDRGDLLAFLDTGAYCESKSLQYNATPRPATVLVSGSRVEVITERESLQDVVRRFRLPTRLMPEATPAATVVPKVREGVAG